MVVNGHQVAEAEVRGDEIDRSSATVAVRLAQGNRVWLRRDTGTATQVEGAFRSSFTGVLITPDPPSDSWWQLDKFEVIKLTFSEYVLLLEIGRAD